MSMYENVEANNARIRVRHSCYICGDVPMLIDTTTLGEPEPSFIPGGWPAPGIDHEHANRPPTPTELEAAGHATLRRILEG